jgi:drug/metabolite transporter (DMT)-like permease
MSYFTNISVRTLILTVLAMVAFASNSLLCRAALRQTPIDPAIFTFVRILSGTVALWLILWIQRNVMVDRTASPERSRFSPQSSPSGRGSPFSPREKVGMRAMGDWVSGFALFAYAVAFSFAYVDLAAGTGALLLFGAVQATMISWALAHGERLDALQITGFVAAVAGLIVLLLPGITAPPIAGSVLMISAGIAWGIYSLRRRNAENAIGATAGNFLRAVPFAILVSLVLLRQTRFDSLGLTYAVISGAITSGIGYVIWYAALPGLKRTSAATVQLSVPVIAAAGGIVFLHEPITLRYIAASIAVLGGIAVVVVERNRVS